MTTEANDTIEPYEINGTGPYAFSFRIFDEDDLTVTALAPDGVDPVTLTVNSHFTVSGVNDEDGGTITLINSAETTYDGYTLDIRSNVVIDQPTSIKNQGTFAPVIHEKAFDRLNRQIQDLTRKVKQKWGYPDNVNLDATMTSRSAWLGKFPYVNEDGEIEPAVVSGTPITQSIIGELLYPITPAEQAALVVPADHSRKPLQSLVMETDRYASIANALSVLGTTTIQPIYYLEDWGAPCDGTQDDAPALNSLLARIYTINLHDTSNSRIASPIIQLPARNMRFKTALNFSGGANGMMGITIQGCGAWTTTIYFDAGTAGQITGVGSSHVTFKGICFRADAIDDDVVTFAPSTSGGGALRRWTFDHCDWFYVWKPFVVTGSSLCDEFKLIGCNFLECYHVVDNDNDQAVNWNFYGCDFEATLDGNTTKNVDYSTMFLLKKGMFVNWMGGSLLLPGSMVVLNTTSSNNFSINSHAMNFDGVRIELIDSATANGHTVGTHVSLVSRIASGYSNVNNLKFTLQNFTMLFRGTLPSLTLFDLRDNWTLCVRNGESETGTVKGYYTANTSTQAGSALIDNCKGISYTEDTTDRTNTFITHEVTVIPNNGADGAKPVQINRSPGTTGLRATMPQCLYAQDLNGNLPQGGTTKNIPTLLNHTILRTLVLQQFETSTQTLTVQLRDQADTTTYASVSLVAGAGGGREDRAAIGLVIGFQIGTEATPVPLMLKFVGTPDTQKGAVWIEYM